MTTNDTPPNHGQPWSEADFTVFREMVATGASNREIGAALGRTHQTVALQKYKHRLSVRATECPVCSGPIPTVVTGRPRRYCGHQCVLAAERERAAAQRLTDVLEARTEWTCAAPDCTEQLPITGHRVKYCSRACCRRTTEANYRADGRRAAAGERANERNRQVKRELQETSDPN